MPPHLSIPGRSLPLDASWFVRRHGCVRSGILCAIAGVVLFAAPAARPASAQSSTRSALIAPLPLPNALVDARNLIKNRSYAPAQARLEAAIASDPDNADAHFLLGYVLFKQQHAAESLRAYTAAAKLRTPSPADLITVASNYVLLNDFSDARHWLTVAADADPRNVNIWYLLGRTEFSLDRAEAAKADFLTCLRLDPNHVKAHYNLGLVYERLHQPEAALAAYRQAITLQLHSPHQDSQPYLDLGMLLLQQANPADAITYLQNAVRLAPENPLAHQELARCLEALGRNDEAAGEMLLCAEKAPKAHEPPFFLGRIYRRLGREADAKQQFDRAAQLAGTHSAVDVPNLEPAEQ